MEVDPPVHASSDASLADANEDVRFSPSASPTSTMLSIPVPRLQNIYTPLRPPYTAHGFAARSGWAAPLWIKTCKLVEPERPAPQASTSTAAPLPQQLLSAASPPIPSASAAPASVPAPSEQEYLPPDDEVRRMLLHQLKDVARRFRIPLAMPGKKGGGNALDVLGLVRRGLEPYRAGTVPIPLKSPAHAASNAASEAVAPAVTAASSRSDYAASSAPALAQQRLFRGNAASTAQPTVSAGIVSQRSHSTRKTEKAERAKKRKLDDP